MVNLLLPIASDLGISEGMTGQTVTAVGILAVITSLSLAPLTASIDRRKILLSLSALLVVSCTMVGQAQSYPALIITRALSIAYAGVSVATILSLPLAVFDTDLAKACG
ncbi:TPA: MFS transporter [Enterobacter roggenkampii]